MIKQDRNEETMGDIDYDGLMQANAVRVFSERDPMRRLNAIRELYIDRAANRLDRHGRHGAVPFDGLARRPKNLGPFQRVPVIAKAAFDRL